MNESVVSILKNKIRKDTMIKFYKTKSVPWNTVANVDLTDTDKQFIQNSEMGFLAISDRM